MLNFIRRMIGGSLSLEDAARDLLRAMDERDYDLVVNVIKQQPLLLQTPIGQARITPLGSAVSSGNTKMVQTLLDYGADPNAKIEQSIAMSALQMASICGFPDISSILLKSGANPLYRDRNGNNALHFALMHTYKMAHTFETDMQLLARNIEVLPTLVKVLLAGGLDPNQKNAEGLSAFEMANKLPSALKEVAELFPKG
jgi:ankyrin repeat protein